MAVIPLGCLGSDADGFIARNVKRLQQAGELVGCKALALPVGPGLAFHFTEGGADIRRGQPIDRPAIERGLDVAQQHGADRFTVLGGQGEGGLARATWPIGSNLVSYSEQRAPVVGVAVDEPRHIGIVTGNITTDIISPPGAHPGKVGEMLAAIFPELGHALIGSPALQLNDNQPLLQIISESTVRCKGNGAEDGELAELLLLAEDTKNSPAGAMPLIQQGMKVAAVFNVLLSFVENDGGMELFDRAK